MGKIGKVLVILGIIILAVIMILLGALYYAYNFHVFKTVRVCMGDFEDIQIPCDENIDCDDFIFGNIPEKDLQNIPSFLRERFDTLRDEGIKCTSTCHVRKLRGFDWESGNLEELTGCESSEKEIVVEIRGKEGLELWEYFNSMKE